MASTSTPNPLSCRTSPPTSSGSSGRSLITESPTRPWILRARTTTPAREAVDGTHRNGRQGDDLACEQGRRGAQRGWRHPPRDRGPPHQGLRRRGWRRETWRVADFEKVKRTKITHKVS